MRRSISVKLVFVDHETFLVFQFVSFVLVVIAVLFVGILLAFFFSKVTDVACLPVVTS